MTTDEQIAERVARFDAEKVRLEAEWAARRERLDADWTRIKWSIFALAIWCSVGIAVGIWHSASQARNSDSRVALALERIAAAMEVGRER